MAKNWTIAEAVTEFQKGNKEAILDIGKRFPLLSNLISQTVAAKSPAAIELLGSLADYNTCNKINSALKAGIEVSDEETDTDEDGSDEAEEKPAKTEKAKAPAAKVEKKESAGTTDYESMGSYPLYQLCKSRSLEVKSKRPKEEYIAALVAADGGKGKAKAKPVVEEEVEDEDEDAVDYSKMSAQDLFKACKKAKIEVEPKKPAKYYIAKLEENEAEEEAPEEEEDWAEEEAPAKATKKPVKAAAAAAAAAKPAKAKAKDDDEDWDI